MPSHVWPKPPQVKPVVVVVDDSVDVVDVVVVDDVVLDEVDVPDVEVEVLDVVEVEDEVEVVTVVVGGVVVVELVVLDDSVDVVVVNDVVLDEVDVLEVEVGVLDVVEVEDEADVVTVVVVGASVVVGDAHVHSAVHATPPAQSWTPGSHCSPVAPSTTPSPHLDRRAANGFPFAPLLLKRPSITPHSGAAILALRRPAPALPHDGHFAVTLVKWRVAVMRPPTARQPLSIAIRFCASTVTESTDPVLTPWTRAPLPGSTRNRPAGHGVAGAFLGHPSRAPPSISRAAPTPNTVSRCGLMSLFRVGGPDPCSRRAIAWLLPARKELGTASREH